ncbi:pyridine nucleotide-disulfide oxidoreductase [Prosthecochloris sp. ZM]|uniref:FAD-dependent pyridine nucleotide-disulphide oxidoreductase n=1 Tax=Prosthecochloris aestuarii (strain DSM 271 / SK 413) TaxID=290512 RepID=B4S4C2_PROA2|nr:MULTISPECIES: FAD-dependent oxidoreductase [Prosthecochloris]ACF45370.1 FAD-dependent pyridine nucleotide-disulphide oxidoreductase [Prosthecochloris aestuarii DSM 271]NEX12701.1 pyridine nucleotide-disulfide oxidoreductase [Prosthecochloris sp.]RDD31437.1 pyridine nucleotide-disulfide oxidoreductase [Prosthecochloris sp. ZM]
MQKNVDILVIGGSAAGIVAATTARAFYPDKAVMIVRKEQKAVVPCGIPYIYGTLKSIEQNIIPAGHITDAGVEMMIDEVVSIDSEKKTATTVSGTVISWDKLVIATGSVPKVPGWLKGTDLDNVFTIPKDCQYLDHVQHAMEGSRKVVIIGGGFIGVEIADELSKKGLDITLVELLPHVLQMAFDEEMSVRAEEILTTSGVKLKLGCKVEEIEGDGKVTGVRLDGGEVLEADLVILSTGYLPNTTLAADAGIKLNELGAIRVDEYMRTENKDIFAVGDCAEKFSFFTRIVKGLMLASTACSEARIAGMNLYKLSRLRTFGGTLSIFSTAIGGTTFAAAGVTEQMAIERGFDIVSASAEGIDKHPKTLPGVHAQRVKLIVNRESGLVLGGSVIGGVSAGELINVIGVIIESMMTIHQVLTLQLGTHPLLTGPPTGYPLLKAAENVAKKMRQ